MVVHIAEPEHGRSAGIRAIVPRFVGVGKPILGSDPCRGLGGCTRKSKAVSLFETLRTSRNGSPRGIKEAWQILSPSTRQSACRSGDYTLVVATRTLRSH